MTSPSPAKRVDTKTNNSTATTTAATTTIKPVKDFLRGWPQSGHTRAGVDASAPHSGQYRYRIAGMQMRLSNRGHRDAWQPVVLWTTPTHVVQHLRGPAGRPTPCGGDWEAWASAGGSSLLDPPSGGPDLGVYPPGRRFKPKPGDHQGGSPPDRLSGHPMNTDTPRTINEPIDRIGGRQPRPATQDTTRPHPQPTSPHGHGPPTHQPSGHHVDTATPPPTRPDKGHRPARIRGHRHRHAGGPRQNQGFALSVRDDPPFSQFMRCLPAEGRFDD